MCRRHVHIHPISNVFSKYQSGTCESVPSPQKAAGAASHSRGECFAKFSEHFVTPPVRAQVLLLEPPPVPLSTVGLLGLLPTELDISAPAFEAQGEMLMDVTLCLSQSFFAQRKNCWLVSSGIPSKSPLCPSQQVLATFVHLTIA